MYVDNLNKQVNEILHLYKDKTLCLDFLQKKNGYCGPG
jgi:hypothetical protein